MEQTTIDLEEIRAAVIMYAEGIRNGDVTKLRSAFHPKAMMFGASSSGQIAVEIQGLYDFVAANKPPAQTGENHRYFISSIHYSGHAATVEMKEEEAFGNNYMNYFHLLKTEERWVIVSKTYNTVAR